MSQRFSMMSLTILTILYDITCNNATYDNILVLKLLYDAIDNSMTSIQYHYQYFTMILMIYINDSNIFILIYPCYIYFFIDFIALCYVSCFHAASSMPWYLSFMYAYVVLCAFKYLYDDT